MKIYFAGSIRGGRKDINLYSKLIKHLKKYGQVLTEHVGDKNLKFMGNTIKKDEYIHERDMKWLLECDLVVAEVSTPSLGVGYEIGRAIENGKTILCIYRPQKNKMLSAMISGCKKVKNVRYKTIEEAKKIIDDFMSQ